MMFLKNSYLKYLYYFFVYISVLCIGGKMKLICDMYLEIQSQKREKYGAIIRSTGFFAFYTYILYSAADSMTNL